MRRVQTLVAAEEVAELENLSHFLLCSEAITSSQIEEIVSAAKQVALAESGEAEDIRRISDAAKFVARNMTVIRQASQTLAQVHAVITSDLADLQTALFGPDNPSIGIRTEISQNLAWRPSAADYRVGGIQRFGLACRQFSPIDSVCDADKYDGVTAHDRPSAINGE